MRMQPKTLCLSPGSQNTFLEDFRLKLASKQNTFLCFHRILGAEIPLGVDQVRSRPELGRILRL
jgi:hypothetical protein